jgi:hypothetical protein
VARKRKRRGSTVPAVDPGQPGSVRDRAGRLVARWRTVWGDWVEWAARNIPERPLPPAPGLLTRLSMAREIEEVLAKAVEDAYEEAVCEIQRWALAHPPSLTLIPRLVAALRRRGQKDPRQPLRSKGEKK